MLNAQVRAAGFGKHASPDEEWLALAPDEDIIDPGRPIVDTHHHLHEVKASPSGVARRYLLDEYAADVATGHNVVATVYIEGHASWRATGPQQLRSIGEVEFANGIAAMSASGHYGNARVAAAIVGHVDLTQGDTTTAAIEAAIVAGNGRLRGIRHGGHWDADPAIRNGQNVFGPGLYRTPEFLAGAARVAGMGLVNEAWVFHPQLGDVCILADALPNDLIVMNHLGGPLGLGHYAEQPKEVFAHWKTLMIDLAQRRNVVIKLSGLSNRLKNFMGHAIPPSSAELAASWKPYFETALELFGAERCIVGSCFPVDKQSATWVAHWNAYKRLLANASLQEKDLIFSGNARRIYGLGADQAA